MLRMTQVMVILIMSCAFCRPARVQKLDDGAMHCSDTSAIIDKIRMAYHEIDSNEYNYQKVEKHLNADSIEQDVLVGYFYGDSLKKVFASSYKALIRTLYDYYFKDDELFYVNRSIIYYYQRPGEMGWEVLRTARDRYYFVDGQLIQWFDTECNKVDPQVESYADEGKRLLNDAARFSKEIDAASK